MSTENRIDGGHFNGDVFMAEHITQILPGRPHPALSGMPRHSPTFTGRETQLDQILAVLRPEETAATVVVTGLAGMGKTELVLQAAHRAQQEDGWFPGGVLFVDLHGYDPVHKVSPKRALATLLRALGVPPDHIPTRIEERAAVYRTVLAERAKDGQRMLVVLDDVPAGEKIHHLLPGDESTATLLSSRHVLADLDALTLTLRELMPASGRKLMSEVLSRALPNDSRVTVAPEDADRIVALCGGVVSRGVV